MPDSKLRASAQDDLALLIAAAQDAGQIARRFFDEGARRWDKPDGAGPVTEADLAVDAYLHDVLLRGRPDYGWLSEETPDGTARLDCERVFIIDPIDGTRSFADGHRTWALSLAVAERGRVIAGVVLLPMRDLLYEAALGSGARCNGAALVVSARTELDGADVLATKPNMDPVHWLDGTVPAFTRHHRPSLAYRLGLAAAGRFDAMMTLRPTWEWDIAAGALIAQEAGAVVTDVHGAALTFNSPNAQTAGVLVAGAALHAELLVRLKARS